MLNIILIDMYENCILEMKGNDILQNILKKWQFFFYNKMLKKKKDKCYNFFSFLNIWTNGNLTPKESFHETSKKLIDLFIPFLHA